MSIFKMPVQRQKKNTFDLSHDVKFSGKIGRLIPIDAVDVVPGDEFNIGIDSLFRMLPLVAPVMAKLKVKTSFFFVPNRILDPNWETFITGEDEVAPPTFVWSSYTEGQTPFSIGGLLGLPEVNSVFNTFNVLAYPIAAYLKIYDDYYRPQQFTDELFTPLAAGNNAVYATWARSTPLPTNWAHDYFTSALPHPQLGAQPVRIPVGGQQVIIDDSVDAPGKFLLTDGSGLPPGAAYVGLDNATDETFVDDGDTNPRGKYDPNGTLVTDPNTAGTIDDLLRATKLMDFLRKSARTGNRYFEQIFSHFGLKSPDSRLQRAEFIGTFRQEIAISEVLSTAETELPLGALGGHGISTNNRGGLRYSVKEHGWIIALVTVMPTSAYQQGIQKKWLRSDRFDYFWPSFATIGEQPILNKEVFVDGSTDTLDNTWGYQMRYHEYKQEFSRVAGLMVNELDFWHLGRKFETLPNLSADFISAEFDDFGRIFADTEGEHFVAQIYFKYTVRRPMPRFGIPRF